MSRGSGKTPGKTGRQITPDEAELWHQLTRSLHRTKIKPRVAAHGGSPAPGAPALPRSELSPVPGQSARPVPAPSPVRAQPLPPGEFDRRTLRQVAAGKIPIDATLDLHGLHQDTAHARLRAFLASSQAKGHRMLLVITGKGFDRHLEGRRASSGGVLRRSVPQWLEGPEFRANVLSYAAAGVRHGGDGALYIRLRKARDA